MVCFITITTTITLTITITITITITNDVLRVLAESLPATVLRERGLLVLRLPSGDHHSSSHDGDNGDNDDDGDNGDHNQSNDDDFNGIFQHSRPTLLPWLWPRFTPRSSWYRSIKYLDENVVQYTWFRIGENE